MCDVGVKCVTVLGRVSEPAWAQPRQGTARSPPDFAVSAAMAAGCIVVGIVPHMDTPVAAQIVAQIVAQIEQFVIQISPKCAPVNYGQD